MFGTSGIRGIYGEDVTEGLALRIASIFASDADLVVARDTRRTGTSLMNAVASGAMASGRNVIDLGIVPTPTLALASRIHGCNGIMLTASHNPEEYNGLKLFSKGNEISRAREKEISSVYSSSTPGAQCAWDKCGLYSEYRGAVADHSEMIVSLVDSRLIKEKKPKVVVDCNGAGAAITPQLLASIGCSVKAINTQLAGFSRPSEPKDGHLDQLSKEVRSSGADFGVAHDGDADRAIILDENGKIMDLDIQLAMMVEHELEKEKGPIVSTVEASMLVKETAESKGVPVFITPVGSLYVSEALEEKNAVFGGEPAGEYVFKRGIHVPDGILTAAKFAELFAEKGRLSALASKYGKYPMLRRKYAVKDKAKEMARISKSVDIGGKRNASDGLRIDADDYWVLIRPSGTEPAIRLTMEARTEEMLKEVSKRAEKAILG
ncbi:MAG: phosphoglucosamine mutase [Candidatus Bilamarchaeaceae archaeon]